MERYRPGGTPLSSPVVGVEDMWKDSDPGSDSIVPGWRLHYVRAPVN